MVTWERPSKDDICIIKVTQLFIGPCKPNLLKTGFKFIDEPETYNRYTCISRFGMPSSKKIIKKNT